VPTPIWLTGAEHGVASTSGGGLFNTLTNAPTIDGTIKRTGNYSIRFYKTSSSTCSFTKTIAGSPTVVVGRYYIYFTTFPAAVTTMTWTAVNSGGACGIRFNNTTKKLNARFLTIGDGNAANLALSTGTWYRVDFKFDVSANPSLIDFSVAPDGGDAVAATQSSTAQAATHFDSFSIGAVDAGTYDFYADDIFLSATALDYPIGAGAVIGLSPSGAGTSSPGTNIKDDGGTLVDDATNPANIELDDVPLNGTTDYIQQDGGTDAIYAEVAFADTTQATINGAMAIVAYQSATATANAASSKIVDEDATITAIYTGDMSETSQFYKSVIIPKPAGGWDMGAVNALKGRVGYASDYNPIPYWHALMVEVDYSPTIVTTYTNDLYMTFEQ
jgi:hypothetical protein